MNREFDEPQVPEGDADEQNRFCVILLRKGGRPQAAWIFARGKVVKLTWSEGATPAEQNDALALNAWKN